MMNHEDKSKKYKKLKDILKFIGFFLAYLIADKIVNLLGIYTGKFFSFGSLVFIILGILLQFIIELIINKFISFKKNHDIDIN